MKYIVIPGTVWLLPDCGQKALSVDKSCLLVDIKASVLDRLSLWTKVVC